MRAISVVLALAVMGSGAWADDGKTAEFAVPKDKVFAAALEMIATKWRIENTDKDSGVISFRTGLSAFSSKGQDMSVLVLETEKGAKVIVNAESRGRQVTTWGEGGRLSKETLWMIGWKLWKNDLIKLADIPKKPQ
jgi:hypothetical protein